MFHHQGFTFGAAAELTGMNFSITNQVYTASAQSPIDLFTKSLIALSAYKPPRGRFPGGCLRTPTGTCLLFRSGKLVFNGIKSEGNLQATVKYCSDVLEQHISSIQLQNLTGYAKFDRKINPAKLRAKVKCFFEPELHPGLFLKFGRVSCIVYTTGAIFTGCRSHSMFEEVCQTIEKLIHGIHDRSVGDNTVLEIRTASPHQRSTVPRACSTNDSQQNQV